jgi:serine O-acetyltransferase
MILLTHVRSDFRRISSSPPTLSRLAYHYVCNLGFRAVVLYRIAHVLTSHGRFRLAAWLTTHCASSTGCDIGPGADIGPALLLHHPVGIVIGNGARVGRNCTIFQSVTLGERGFPRDDHRYPIVGDNVTIGAGTAVLGAVSIGSGAVIGANSVVTRDVPISCIAAGIPAHVLRQISEHCGASSPAPETVSKVY